MWLLVGLLIAADAPPDVVWANRTENLAVRTREAATTLAQTAAAASASGRAERLAPMRSDVEELVRLADLLAKQAAAPPVPDGAEGGYSPRSGVE